MRDTRGARAGRYPVERAVTMIGAARGTGEAPLQPPQRKIEMSYIEG